MTPDEQRSWFQERTNGAPPVLRARAERFFVASVADDLPNRLAAAGHGALAAATLGGANRAAALDLLAADALITLALLATAEHAPARLGPVAAQLRMHASARA